MIKYAITGNIASGKSEFEKVLEAHDFVVLDTDLITHDILIDRPEIGRAFSEYDVFEFGRLSKEKLGKLVFSNPELKSKLESIVHPLILDELNTAFKVYEDESAIFVSVPLLFEVGWENLFDKIIFIKSDDDIRLKRLMKRNGYDKEYALKRIKSQDSQEDKLSKSDFIIENNGSIDEFRAKITEFISNNITAS